MTKVTQNTILIFLALVVAVSGFGFTTEAKKTTKCAYYHTVWYGETLYKIGLRYGMTWDKIASANNIKKPGQIYAGDVLCIPTTKYGTGGPYYGYNYYGYYNYYGTGGPYYYDDDYYYYGSVPLITVTDVNEGKNVTIKGYYFPKNTKFNVYIGNYGTAGVGGVKVSSFNTGNKTTFSATFTIPKTLKNKARLAIRVQSPKKGVYSYNWFNN